MSQLSWPVWLLGLGRLISQLGTGFTLFFIPIFFVEQVGFSATQVGLGLGIAAIAGVIGRIFGGTLSDATFGRKRTLLLALGISALGTITLGLSHSFQMFVVANCIAGLGQGLYWPSTETMIADLTTREQRNEAYAINRLGDNLGLSLGVALASIWVEMTQTYRVLFWIDGLTFLGFFVIVLGFIQESRPSDLPSKSMLSGWWLALTDRVLLTYLLANILFTIYISQLSAALPFYLKQFVGLSLGVTGTLLFLHGLIMAGIQIPVVRRLNHWTRVNSLRLSCVLWALGFGLVERLDDLPNFKLQLAGLALVIFAEAAVIYLPSASALVADLAPIELRGVYLSLNALCWAIGFALGPIISGPLLDQSPDVAQYLWVIWILSIGALLLILQGLAAQLPARLSTAQDRDS